MQAILVADYSFTPIEYWRGVSPAAREFIKLCLTIDPTQRMTAHQALSHPFVAGEVVRPNGEKESDLLPVVKKNFNARRTLHAAIDTVRAINKLREGQNGMMDGIMSHDPHRVSNGQRTAGKENGTGLFGAGDEVDGEGDSQMKGVERNSGQGQTDAQIEAQKRKIAQATTGLWSGKR